MGHQVADLGTDSTQAVDYPVYARAVAQAVLEGRAERAVLICGSGAGASVAANKFRGIRASVCHDSFSARAMRRGRRRERALPGRARDRPRAGRRPGARLRECGFLRRRAPPAAPGGNRGIRSQFRQVNHGHLSDGLPYFDARPLRRAGHHFAGFRAPSPPVRFRPASSTSPGWLDAGHHHPGIRVRLRRRFEARPGKDRALQHRLRPQRALGRRKRLRAPPQRPDGHRQELSRRQRPASDRNLATDRPLRFRRPPARPPDRGYGGGE